MALIDICNLTFSYDGGYDTIFDHVSFQIDTRWKLGFTGRNGRGKTTFLKLLMGQLEYSGTISAPVEFEYFPYRVKDPEDLTVEVAEGICPDTQLWQLQRELSKLELDEEALYRPFSTLSNGERTKVLLAVLFLKENSFLLIDEPTNHLDLHGRQLVSRYLNSKNGFILVSHDRTFLDSCVDHILSINRANIEIQKGNFSSWLDNKDRRDAFELAENEKLTREIGRLKKTAAEKSAWADRSERQKTGIDPMKTEMTKNRRPYLGAKSKKANKRSKAIEARTDKAIEEKSGLLKNIETADSLKITQQAFFRGLLAELRDVAVSYDGKAVCEPVSFRIETGDRIALQGGNGSGKSSIIKLILGENISYSGVMERSDRLRISYVPQDTSFLRGSLSEFSKERELDDAKFKAILWKLDFRRSLFEQDMSLYSEGQKKKVLIAASLCEDAHLHVWDEPLNYIDVLSRMQIEDLLLGFEPTILFVEHDAAFTERIATKVVTFLSHNQSVKKY